MVRPSFQASPFSPAGFYTRGKLIFFHHSLLGLRCAYEIKNDSLVGLYNKMNVISSRGDEGFKLYISGITARLSPQPHMLQVSNSLAMYNDIWIILLIRFMFLSLMNTWK